MGWQNDRSAQSATPFCGWSGLQQISRIVTHLSARPAKAKLKSHEIAALTNRVESWRQQPTADVNIAQFHVP
jgi:hypothetical protein